MTVTVTIDLGYEFTVKALFKEVFDLLADVPKSVAHFPKVDRLVDLGGGVYRWEMQKVGTAQVNLQTVYASKYVVDRGDGKGSGKGTGTVVWTPVIGEGNARVGGSWTATDKKTTTALVLKIDGEVDVPVPGLMKRVVAPVVQGEFEKLVEAYIDNLIEEFGGEA